MIFLRYTKVAACVSVDGSCLRLIIFATHSTNC
jgi:hypothetical protein